MMAYDLSKAGVLVAGAGAMGTGIAQVAAQSGHEVMLYDNRADAPGEALRSLEETLQKLVDRGRIGQKDARSTLARIRLVHHLDDVAGSGLAVEAVSEDIGIKRSLFAELEDRLDEMAVLATNTSSLSVTAIAAKLRNPGRLVGMHFFNPAPVMKLVEVVSGLDTDPRAADAVFELAGRWGKVPVHAASTPGFIVNRIARPFYAEALEVLQERACDHVAVDACLRGAGFRMGPCELMDLIGHDTNFAVTESVFHANFMDRRYKPSLIQKALVEGGRLGRKSGQGFYRYGPEAGTADTDVSVHTYRPPDTGGVILHGRDFVADLLGERLRELGLSFEQVAGSGWTGIESPDGQLRLTEGLPASALGENVAVFDLPIACGRESALAMSCSARASADWHAHSAGWLAALGFVPRMIGDVPGLVVARTIAMLINEAADAVQQGVCTESGADDAMKLGVNYPEGPFEWLSKWGIAPVIGLLDHLDAYYRGERYRVSPLLRRRAWGRPGRDDGGC
ncbi:MAG: 3-hydroxyacyl-CoA dehydrogenase [Gammaproteobacteria bacterium]|nr:3-hydroxyacyl-CoA dehydrogenase [Gammaproteobacteria bacterium]